MAAVGSSYPALMAQAFVPGPVASCQVVYDHGEPLAWATSFKTRTWPGPYGPSSAVAFAPIPGVAEQLPLIGQALGFHGALTLDLIVDERTGQPVVIEVNARPAGIMSRGRRAGVDFAGAMRQLLLGAGGSTHTGARAGRSPPASTRRTWCAASRRGNSRHCATGSAAATLADLPWTDPRVFLSNTRFLLSHLVRRA